MDEIDIRTSKMSIGAYIAFIVLAIYYSYQYVQMFDNMNIFLIAYGVIFQLFTAYGIRQVYLNIRHKFRKHKEAAC